MKLLRHRSDVLGWVAFACTAMMWLFILRPRSMRPLLPVFGWLGPLFWVVPLTMIVLPVIAAKQGSKWWLAVTAAAVITLVVVIGIALD